MDFATARTKMVDNQIRTTDVTEWRILKAFLTVPREDFVPEQRRTLAYIDGDVPLGGGRYVMEPSPFAKLLQFAAIVETDAVLDVGCGTGYGAAILSQIAGSVVALEEVDSLAESARTSLARLGAENCTIAKGPLSAGWAAGGPYDVIFFEGAVDVVPGNFFDQLKKGGRLLAVEGSGNAASARLYFKDEKSISNRFGFNCSVRPLPGFGKAAAFAF